MKLIIINKMHATPAMFRTYEQANEAVKNLFCDSNVSECRIISITTMDIYLNGKYGDDFYAVYAPAVGEWVIKERGVSAEVEHMDWGLFSDWFEAGLK